MRNTFWRVKLTGFVTFAKNLHVYLQNSQFTVRAESISSAFAGGVEGSLTLWWRWFSGGFNFTYLETEDTGGVVWWKGKRIPGMPRVSGNLFVKYSLGRFDVEYSGRFELEKYLDRVNSKRTEPFFSHDISFVIHLYRENLLFEVSANNISDEREYDFMGFPLPGRSFYLKVILRLKNHSKEVAA